MQNNPIIQAVLGRIIAQQEKGLAKYGKLVQVDSHSTDEWIEHLQQELSDAQIYLECIKQLAKEQKHMNMNEYQALAQRTANNQMDRKLRRAVAALGLAGEAGEVADMVKKNVGHGHPIDGQEVKKELGDVLWYVAENAFLYGFSLEDIATANIEKLKKRYPEGFSEAKSINRTE